MATSKIFEYSRSLYRILISILLYSCESENLRALLDVGLGKDLSAELSTPMHRSAMEQLLQHHKLGKYLANQSASEEKVSYTRTPQR